MADSKSLGAWSLSLRSNFESTQLRSIPRPRRVSLDAAGSAIGIDGAYGVAAREHSGRPQDDDVCLSSYIGVDASTIASGSAPTASGFSADGELGTVQSQDQGSVAPYVKSLSLAAVATAAMGGGAAPMVQRRPRPPQQSAPVLRGAAAATSSNTRNAAFAFNADAHVASTSSRARVPQLDLVVAALATSGQSGASPAMTAMASGYPRAGGELAAVLTGYGCGLLACRFCKDPSSSGGGAGRRGSSTSRSHFRGAYITSSQQSSASSELDAYAIGKLLGRGAFGKVNVGVHKQSGEQVAMKFCDKRRLIQSGRNRLNDEVEIMQLLKGHPNLVQLHNVIDTQAQVVIVLELCILGDLMRLVKKRRALAEDCARRLFGQLIHAVEHMHLAFVAHRDLKLENLLLSSMGQLKVADFGVAKVVEPPDRELRELCGTPSYMAPEVLKENGYAAWPADLWSTGVALHTMLCGAAPFKGETVKDLKHRIIQGRYCVPAHLSQNVGSLLMSLLEVDPCRRLTAKAALEHLWLQGSAPTAPFGRGRTASPTPSSLQASQGDAMQAVGAFAKRHNHSFLNPPKAIPVASVV